MTRKLLEVANGTQYLGIYSEIGQMFEERNHMAKESTGAWRFVTLFAEAAKSTLPASLLKQLGAALNPEPGTAFAVALAVVNPFAGAFITLLLTAATGSSDTRLEAIFENTKVLRAGPMRRAMIQLKEASSLTPKSGDEERFQQLRYANALESLDEAESLAPDHEKPRLWFLKALVQAAMPGGRPSARAELERLRRYLVDRVDWIDKELVHNSARIQEHEGKLAALPERPARGGGGLANWSVGEEQLKRGVIVTKIRKREQYAKELAELRGDLQVLLLSIAALTSAP
jgi:hypothetical protein